MRIDHYSESEAKIWIDGGKWYYTYLECNLVKYRRVQSFIKKGFEGKAWQMLKSCRLESKAKMNRVRDFHAECDSQEPRNEP